MLILVMATTIVFYILMEFVIIINGPTADSLLFTSFTTESLLSTSFMGYLIEYEDIDVYSCIATTTITPDEPSTIYLTSPVTATTSTTSTSTSISTSTSTSISTTTTSTSTSTTTTTITSTSTTTTTITSTSTTTTTMELTTMLTTSSSAFVAPTCANQSLGISCNMSSDPCTMAQPCLNLATCYLNTSLPLGYTCACVSGFSGTNCQIDKRLCSPSSACLYGGICNQTANDSSCTCPTGKTGDHCEYEVDVCSSINCKNNAQCVSSYGNWSCLCTNPALYSGVYCEIKSSSLIIKETISRSLSGVAIGCLVTVISFFIIMDILKYVFNIDPVDDELRSQKGKKENDRQQERRKKKFNKSKKPIVAIRFHYIHA